MNDNTAKVVQAMGWIVLIAGFIIIVVGMNISNTRGGGFEAIGYFIIAYGVSIIPLGIFIYAFGHHIELTARIAEATSGMLAYIKGQDGAESAQPASDPIPVDLSHLRDYVPQRDPPVTKEMSYRSRQVRVLQDGTIAAETPAGWKRFRSIKELDGYI